MALLLSSSIKANLLDWAAKAAPDECCGLLMGQEGRVEAALLAQNVADDPARHFEIDPALLIATEKAARNGARAIIGYFHSHPPPAHGEPSQTDIRSAANDGRIWIIIAQGGISAWRPLPDAKGEIAAFEPVAVIEG